jgi:hypothetical protein
MIFPPWETVYWYFKIWNKDGVTDRIHDPCERPCVMRRAVIRWPARRSWTPSR